MNWEALRLSALVGIGATLLVMPPAIVLGRLLAVSRFRGKAFVETALLLPLVLPPVVTGYALLVLFGRRGPFGSTLAALGLPVVFTWRACVIASAVMAFPLAYRACRAAFESVDPRFPAVARTLGASRLDAFLSVTLPLARPGVLAGTVLAYARAWGVRRDDRAREHRGRRARFRSPSSGDQSRGTEGGWQPAPLCVLLAVGALIASEPRARASP